MDADELRRQLLDLQAAHHHSQERRALTREEILELFAKTDEEAEANYRTLHVVYGRGVGKSAFYEEAKNITTPLDDESEAKLAELRENRPEPKLVVPAPLRSGKEQAQGFHRAVAEATEAFGLLRRMEAGRGRELEDTTRTYPTTNNRFKKRGRA